MKSLPIILFGSIAMLVATEAFGLQGDRSGVPEPQSRISTATLSTGPILTGLADATDPTPKNATPAYLLTIFLGFGTGHFYLGAPHAVTFLVLDGAGVAGMALGGVLVAAGESYRANCGGFDLFCGFSQSMGRLAAGLGLIGLSGTYFLVVRILEVVDIFRQADVLRGEEKVASARIRPTIVPTADGVSFGLNVSFR